MCGPLGTEPKPGFSVTRFDRSESVVYSRSSTALTSVPSSFQKYVIPPKDTPKVRYQVNVCVPEEELANVSRLTRSRTSMFTTRNLKESSDSESENESSTSSTDDMESEKVRTVSRRRKAVRTRRYQNSNVKPKPSPLKVSRQFLELTKFVCNFL